MPKTEAVLDRNFIVGCARSGTTLLQSMVGAHPELSTFPETHFWLDTVPFRRFLRPFKIYGEKEFGIVGNYLERHSYPEQILFEFSGPYFSTVRWSGILCRILDAMADNEAAGWLEKTPRHLHYVDLIERSSPDARFIHIIREGKNVVASLYEVSNRHPEHWYGKKSIDDCIERWISDIEKSKRCLGRNGHMFLRYERLTDDPEKKLREVCAFLEMNYHPDMIRSYRQEAGKIIEEKESWKEANVSGRARVDKFQEHFTEEERKYIKERTGPVDLSVFSKKREV